MLVIARHQTLEKARSVFVVFTSCPISGSMITEDFIVKLSDIHFAYGWQTATGFYKKTIRIPRNYIVVSLAILIGLASGFYLGFPMLTRLVLDALVFGLLCRGIAALLCPMWKKIDGATTA
jgi:hypothetical protein